MSSKKTSATDTIRKLALLWGSQTEAGRSGLTVKAILSAAIEIADADGVDALSMRKVAERLGVGTMSLYTHITSKGDLLDFMLDTAYSQLYQTIEEPSQQGGWREGMRFVARRNWELYLAHPWVLQLISGRPVFGPHLFLKYEAELRPLDEIGLDDMAMDGALTLVLTHVEGCARTVIGLNTARVDSGVSDVEWWVSQGSFLDKIVDGSQFPVSGRVGTSVAQISQAENPEYVFAFGLERILAGIEALIAEKKLDGE